MNVGARFNLSFAGIGEFVFRDKGFRDEIKIQALASELLGRQVASMRPDERNLAIAGLAYAHISVLAVETPPGWNIDALDPLEPADQMKLSEVWEGLSQELARFREARKPRSVAPGDRA